MESLKSKVFEGFKVTTSPPLPQRGFIFCLATLAGEGAVVKQLRFCYPGYLNKISKLEVSQHFFFLNTEEEEGTYNLFLSQLANNNIFVEHLQCKRESITQ